MYVENCIARPRLDHRKIWVVFNLDADPDPDHDQLHDDNITITIFNDYCFKRQKNKFEHVEKILFEGCVKIELLVLIIISLTFIIMISKYDCLHLVQNKQN